MKKLTFLAIALLSISSATFAQAVKKSTAPKMVAVKTTTTTAPKSKVVPMKTTTTATKPAVVASAKPAIKTKTTSTKHKSAIAKHNGKTHLKKDGTADKRYKSTVAKTPMKKDGTADMRYKANKKKA